MNTDQLFEKWKEQKHNFTVGESFCNDVMRVVNAPEKKAITDLLIWFNTISAEPIARFGIVLVGAVGGACRVVLAILAFVYEAIPLT